MNTTKTVHHYVMTPVFEEDMGGIATACMLDCSCCGGNIDGMGGPGNNALCKACYRFIYQGKLYRIFREMCIMVTDLRDNNR